MSYNRITVDISRPTNTRSVFVSRCKSDADMLTEFIASTWPDQNNRPDRSRFVEVSPGLVVIDKRCLRAWLINATSPNVEFPPTDMIFVDSTGCEQNSLTGTIVLPPVMVTYLQRILCYTDFGPAKTTEDWDPDVRNAEYEIDYIQDFAMAGIEILNLPNLIHTPTKPYMLSQAASKTIGEIPIIKVESLDRDTVLETIRFTHDLSRTFGGVVLRPSKPYQGVWVDGYQQVREYARSETAKTHWDEDASSIGLPNNLSDQVLKKIPSLKGVYELSSLQVKKPRDSFDFTSLWEEKDVERTAKVPTWVQNCASLSTDAKEALAALPENLENRKPVRYLAGIGSNERGESLLEALKHPRKDTLKFLPQILALAGTLYHYVHSCADISDTDARIDAAFRTTLDHAPGTISPWTYVGTKGSVFPLHQEDALLPSANQLVLGQPKVWINITSPNLVRLQGMMEGHRVPCYPLHRGTFFHPVFLHNSSIPFNIVVQKQGDLFLPDAAAAHQGWNAGNNLAEAVNYADVAAFRYIQDNLMQDDKGVWPCVCGKYSVPGQPPSTPSDTTAKFYDPTEDDSGQLSCSAFYKWFLILQRNLVPHLPDDKELVPGEILVRLRRRVYIRMQGEHVPKEPDH